VSEEQDDSSKTEEPTGKKLEEAHKQGQYVVSREVNTWLSVLAIMIVLVYVAPYVFKGLGDRLSYYIAEADQLQLDRGGIGLIMTRVLRDVVVLVWLPLLILLLFGMSGTILQSGFHVTWTLLEPKFSKISPLTGIKRLLSPIPQAIELAKAVVKLVVVTVIAYLVLKPVFVSVEATIGLEMWPLLEEMRKLALALFIGVLLVMAAVAAGDFAYQYMQHYKKLRMTKQEIKDEHKQSEGDPMVKGRLRGLRMEKARKRMMASVPKADVVVTNPTHYAVALQYDPTTMQAPVVLAMGIDQIALNIRKIAEEHKIPIVRNPPLARALYDTAEIDREIPADHYKAVAEVISYVFKLKGRRMG